MIRTRTNPGNVPKESLNHASSRPLGTNPRNSGTKSGTQYSIFPDKNILGNVPNGPWVHVQVQGGYASAPCNPVTMSPDMDLVRE